MRDNSLFAAEERRHSHRGGVLHYNVACRIGNELLHSGIGHPTAVTSIVGSMPGFMAAWSFDRGIRTLPRYAATFASRRSGLPLREPAPTDPAGGQRDAQLFQPALFGTLPLLRQYGWPLRQMKACRPPSWNSDLHGFTVLQCL